MCARAHYIPCALSAAESNPCVCVRVLRIVEKNAEREAEIKAIESSNKFAGLVRERESKVRCMRLCRSACLCVQRRACSCAENGCICLSAPSVFLRPPFLVLWESVCAYVLRFVPFPPSPLTAEGAGS